MPRKDKAGLSSKSICLMRILLRFIITVYAATLTSDEFSSVRYITLRICKLF